MRKMTVGLALAGLLGAWGAGAAWAGLITYIDPGGASATTCGGGVAGVVLGADNDITAECAWGDTEVVLCGLPGAVDWLPGPDDQITVTCEEPK